MLRFFWFAKPGLQGLSSAQPQCQRSASLPVRGSCWVCQPGKSQGRLETLRSKLRKLVPALTAIIALLFAYLVAGDPAQASGATQTAAQYSFKQLPIAMPPDYYNQKMNT